MTDPGHARLLVDRVAARLGGRELREVRMFGALAVMVDEAMVVAAHADGSLLVRVDPAEDEALLAEPGAARAEMGAGRSMGVGWIRVDATALRHDVELERWLGAAMRHRDGPARSGGTAGSAT